MNQSKSYRSQLLNLLSRAYNITIQTKGKERSHTEQVCEIYQHHSEQRRKFISNMAKAGIAVGAAGILNSCKKITDFVPGQPSDTGGVSNKKNQPAIVIVGAGIAGLNCAYQLQQRGYDSAVYEGSSRISGRIFTKTDILAPGLYTELGGEFIDSNHKDIINLCTEFNLNLLDTGTQAESAYVRDSFYIDGRFYTEDEVITAFHPYAARIKADIKSLPGVMTYDDHDAITEYFDSMSIKAYLDSIGMSGFIRKGIETAYLTEYGLETDVQSSINFLFLFSANTANGFHIFGSSDERYKIEGGNQSLTRALYAQVKNSVNLEHKLVKITQTNNGYILYFMNANGSTISVNADIIIAAIPFTLLREIELDVPLPPWKKNAINNLGYGINSKLLLGFNNRVWRNYQHSGYVFTNEVIQTGWDNSWIQSGTAGGYTIYQGGNKGLALGNGTPQSQAPQFIQQMQAMWPGCGAAFNGNVKRMHWPDYPFTKGSYASYKVGQYTTIRGAEIKNIGNLYFAGEHCSANFQGFMNGAAETGRIAAKTIIQSIKAGNNILIS